MKSCFIKLTLLLLMSSLFNGLSSYLVLADTAYFEREISTQMTAECKSSYKYYGEAYDLDKPDELLYREFHTVWQDQKGICKRQVSYQGVDDASNKISKNKNGKNKNGKNKSNKSNTKSLIAKKINYYPSKSYQPDFILEDQRRDYVEQAKLDGNKLILSLTDSSDKEKAKKRIDLDSLVVDAGFDDFVRYHWATLISGESIEFSFASVARLSVIDFDLIPIKTQNNKLYLKMELSSSLLAWLMPAIKLEYDLASKNLLRYRGLSNIQDAQGEGLYVDLRFYYSQDPFD